MAKLSRDLAELAEFHGIQRTYNDVHDRAQTASTESVLRVLQCLGVSIERPEQASDALRQSKSDRSGRWLDPVHVFWQGDPAHFTLQLPTALNGRTIACRLTTEQGQVYPWTAPATQCRELEVEGVEGVGLVKLAVPIPESLPSGYHELQVEIAGQMASSCILAAPLTAYSPAKKGERCWGTFVPLYALSSQKSWGAGDFSDLAALNDWVADRGGGMVATLPLLASFYDRDGDESPYRPVSRLFWNEFYLDLRQVPELDHCVAAREEMESAAFSAEVEQLNRASLVDYRRQMVLKQNVLRLLSAHFFSASSGRRAAFETFVGEHPELKAYAQFRAAAERHGRPWSEWLSPLAEGQISSGDYSEAIYQYHLYVQWLVHEQLASLSQHARERGLTWYLDLPLGVHPDGFDTWRHRGVFVKDVSVGAPPDAFFTQGQYWDFPPLHPQRLREQGYSYLLAVLRAHLQYAGLLRIDHVMGLHRLFCIPQGMAAKDGVYVRYPADEWYATLTIESQRHRARIIGENLGTVPPDVDMAMDKHDIGRLYVVQYEGRTDDDEVLPEVPYNTVASLNTHDMPPFAAFWQGLDIDDRRDLGLMTQPEAKEERQQRAAMCEALVDFLRSRGHLDPEAEDLPSILTACLAFLSSSRAEVVLLNLEDLWLETAPQNTPGTSTERVNWRRRTRLTLEELRKAPRILAMLQHLGELRSTRP